LADATSVAFTGTGVTATVQPGGTSTSMPVIINIESNAIINQRQFSVNTPTGSSDLYTGFTITGGTAFKNRADQLTSE
jgi:hypothetical protein